MKKIFSTLAIIFAGTQLFATIRTCNNNNPSPGQYSTLTAAVTASVGFGDTIYLSGSPVSYGNITLSSPICIIGTGQNPSKQNPLISTIGNINVQAAAVASKLTGLEIGNISIASTSSGTLNISRSTFNIFNVIQSAGLHVNIYSSILKGAFSFTNGATNLNLKNCIVTHYLDLSTFDENVSIRNCVFIGSYIKFVSTISANGNAVIKNNIFYGPSPDADITVPPFVNQAIYTHNISYLNTFPDDDGNNIVANPLFVNVPIGTTAYNPAHDYHLQATSPGVLNLGDDLTQRGIYGSILPNTFSVTGMPGIPSIQTMSITPATVLSGQSIQVNFSSKTNQ